MLYTSLSDMFLLGTDVSFAVLNLYYPGREITVTKSISGDGALVRLASQVLSFDLIAAGWQVDDSARRLLSLERFTHLGGIRDVAAGQLPAAGLKYIERLTGIHAVYGRALRNDEAVVGNILLLTTEESLEDESLMTLEKIASCVEGVLAGILDPGVTHVKQPDDPLAVDDRQVAPAEGAYVPSLRSEKGDGKQEKFVPDIYLGLDSSLKIVFANHAVVYLGQHRSKVLGKSIHSLLGEESRTRLVAEINALLSTVAETASRTITIENPHGRFRLLLSRGPAGLKRESDEAVTIILRETSTEHRLSAAFLQREEMLRQLADAMSEAVWIESVNPRQILYTNPRFAGLFALEPATLAGDPGRLDRLLEPAKSDNESYTPSQSQVKRQIPADSRPTQAEYRLHSTSRGESWIRIRTYPILNPDTQPLFINIAEDITQERKAQVELETRYRSARNLLHEMNHRIKNNLSIVAGLTGIAASRADSQAVKQEFELLENKISSIALVHELLYPGEAGVRRDFGFYCENLIRILSPATLEGIPIRLESSFAEFDLPPSTAGILGLIITELVTNAAKHAYPGGFSDPAMRIEFTRETDSRGNLLTLTVADNGVRLDFDPLTARGDSLGMEILTTLIDQIEGRISFTQLSDWKEFSVSWRSEETE